MWRMIMMMQEDSAAAAAAAADSVAPGPWRCPFFNGIVATIRTHLEVDRSIKNVGSKAFVYTLKDGFLPNDRSWIRGNRDNKHVLYRPQIVNDLVQRVTQLLECKEATGMIVTGPPGVGKSYSLINLTRYLLASGKYHVTIIPDGSQWSTLEDFFDFILQSLGIVNPSIVSSQYRHRDALDQHFKDFLHDIDQLLNEYGMQWVFVFDHINTAIFAQQNLKKKTAQDSTTMLPFPFSLIRDVMKPGRIISIISAPTNYYDASYRMDHPGFEDYKHPVQLDADEIEILYPPEQIASWGEWNDLEYATGRVPRYLKRWAADTANYSNEVHNNIKYSLHKLRQTQKDNWKAIVQSLLSCILHSSLMMDVPKHFDRNYSLPRKEGNHVTIVPLFPLVEEVYRDYLWEDLLTFTANEKAIQDSRRSLESTTPSDFRERLFEQMVITRLVTKGFRTRELVKILQTANIKVKKDVAVAVRKIMDVKRERDQAYPRRDGAFEDYGDYFIPMARQHPAVHLIFQVESVVIAFHMHIPKRHENLVFAVQNWIHRTTWRLDYYDTIILVCLSPDARTTGTTKKITYTFSSSELDYATLFYSIYDFEALADMR